MKYPQTLGHSRVSTIATVLLFCWAAADHPYRHAAGQVTEAAALESLCVQAAAHLTTLDMATVIEPDTMDDWRTDQRVPGCRITSAGLTRRSLTTTARELFRGIRGAGWERTPDPQDAPNESSLRFRRSEVDCLFSFYSGGLLNTDAALEVDDRRVPQGSETRYNVLVQCIPAAPSAGAVSVSVGGTSFFHM